MPKKRKKAAKKTKKKAKKKLRKKLKRLRKEENNNLVFFTKNASHNFLCERRFFLFV